MTFTVTVEKRGSKGKSSTFPLKLELPNSNPTVANLKAAIHAKSAKLSPSRQRLTTVDKKPLTDDSAKLESAGIRNGDTIQVKDLGPQVAWRTVFLTEYAGPLFIHPLIYYYSPQVFGRQYQHSRMQQIAFALVMAHYAKREFETLFVHKFSNATMPLFNIFKNSAHYWILSGVLLAAGVYGPWAGELSLIKSNSIRLQDSFLHACVAAWAVGQAGNLICHVMLSNLRPAGTKQRKIPRGFLFELVSCPNYTFEVSRRSFKSVYICGQSLTLSSTDSHVDRIHGHDDVSRRSALQRRIRRPDAGLGAQEAPQLPQGVLRLPTRPQGHVPLHHLKEFSIHPKSRPTYDTHSRTSARMYRISSAQQSYDHSGRRSLESAERCAAIDDVDVTLYHRVDAPAVIRVRRVLSIFASLGKRYPAPDV